VAVERVLKGIGRERQSIEAETRTAWLVPLCWPTCSPFKLQAATM